MEMKSFNERVWDVAPDDVKGNLNNMPPHRIEFVGHIKTKNFKVTLINIKDDRIEFTPKFGDKEIRENPSLLFV